MSDEHKEVDTDGTYYKYNGAYKIKQKQRFNPLSTDEKPLTVYWTPGLRQAYIFHLCIRIIIEIIFFFFLFLIQTEQHHSWNVS